jgi:CubicO group peptidase (beta-lactamase class C family)
MTGSGAAGVLRTEAGLPPVNRSHEESFNQRDQFMKPTIASSLFRSAPSHRRARGRGVGIPLLFLALTLGTATHGTAQITDRQALVAALDSAARAHADQAMVPGVAVAMVRGADTLLMRGYGKVDLEWDVATPADAGASYEIGSMTKQFTAAALLQLAEEGKVDLDADITAYLPDYDTQGHGIPVRRLLDHTSGIKGYTEMPAFGGLRMVRLPRDTLVTLVQAEPLEFEPGTALIYNNSAYFLLGLIIEKVSGQSYEEYVTEHLFKPVGMEGSYYCSERAIRKGRAHGYDATPGGLERAAYLDHTWPYAAGSLCSTVGDLVRWNQALHGGSLLSEDAYQAMITPQPLEDGTPTRYAGGLLVMGEGRHRVFTHGGGINGFLSDGRYYPQDDLTVVVLQNSTGSPGPGALTAALSSLVLGPPPALEGTPFTGSLDDFTGRYVGPARGRPLIMVVTREDDALVFTPEGTTNSLRPVHLGDLTWGMGDIRIRFVREGEAMTRLILDQGSGIFVLEREDPGEG